MTNNNLTDEQLEELISELETCGIYGRQVRALYELQQYRKAADQSLPDVSKVYGLLDERARARTSEENIADVLEACRAATQQP